jgi:hypothetical protein
MGGHSHRTICRVGFLGNAGLSDARLRRLKAKLIYPNHRLPPWPNEDATPRDRSNRLLAGSLSERPENRIDARLITRALGLKPIKDIGVDAQ